MTAIAWIGVFALSGGGAVARYLVDVRIGERLRSTFPFGILVVNVSGALVLGMLTGLALSHDEALLAGTATVGSYTTFSTWMLDSERLAENGEVGFAVTNVALSLVLGVSAAALGRLLA